MKKLFSIFSLFGFLFVFAQESTENLIVHYQSLVKIDLDKALSKIPPQKRAEVEAMLRDESKNGISIDYTLKTNGKQSVYQIVEKIDNSQSEGGQIANMIRQNDSSPYYKNIAKGYYVVQFNITGLPNYITKDSLGTFNWKITREKSQILGYEVRKAIGEKEGQKIIAWYAPKLNIKDGPAHISGLPGLILKTESELPKMGATLTITATKIKISTTKIEINEPTKGIFVTEKELNEKIKAHKEKARAIMSNGIDTD
ncbi:GLPGLI family protein [Ornithobacterium rhinotracheale]|uniref:GLPGLI family protein n=1 Tax=Ornithobacterium rhinotracheale TaxID=28251 RepID=UPI00162A1799|nr:GLPGLI family protein [Ornithobacterium rhinotracheale]UOH77793.1 GLPGLI family protein [Ornithobacterium rhinotracheale]